MVEFVNCSYLGLDLHPNIINAYRNSNPEWGVNFCCARSRFSTEPAIRLEKELSDLFGGYAIAFPSVTTTHLSVMPLIASGALIDQDSPPNVRLVFDKYAHASMQFLKPILAEEATVSTISHNDLNALENEVLQAKNNEEVVVYVADGVYSMGGLCPIETLMEMSNYLGFYLYIDDAHGTSIFGDWGEGPILSRLNGDLPNNIFLTFCLSKGFGCNGGGVLLSQQWQDMMVRSYGQIYAFSAAIDFCVVEACLESIKLHYNGEVKARQRTLKNNVALYDKLIGHTTKPFSPIRMIPIGGEDQTIEAAEYMLDLGFFVSAVFFPVVPQARGQLRICIAANHTYAQLEKLTQALKEVQKIYGSNKNE